jgi:hypothetical protein
MHSSGTSPVTWRARYSISPRLPPARHLPAPLPRPLNEAPHQTNDFALLVGPVTRVDLDDNVLARSFLIPMQTRP